MLRQLSFYALLLGLAIVPAALSGQEPSNSQVVPRPQTPAPAAQHRGSSFATVPRTPAPRVGEATTASPTPESNSVPYSQPQIVVTTPAPAPAAWSLHERVGWAANIVLVVLGYVGIFLALRTLKNIERGAERGVSTAQAALDAAQSALEQAQALARAERPWIMVTVEPFLTMENSFKVMATNRGRSPAKIVSRVDRVRIAANETELPQNPEYERAESMATLESFILLPGESIGIRAFSRDEVPSICTTTEALQRIQLWQESIFVHGRVTYVDLAVPLEKQVHETDWCCRYIHGKKTSALVLAGPPEYNNHS